jgi:hypothetical protein
MLSGSSQLTAEKQKGNPTTKTPRHEEKHEGMPSGIFIRRFSGDAARSGDKKSAFYLPLHTHIMTLKDDPAHPSLCAFLRDFVSSWLDFLAFSALPGSEILAVQEATENKAKDF